MLLIARLEGSVNSRNLAIVTLCCEHQYIISMSVSYVSICFSMLHVVMPHNVHKSGTSHVNAQMYIDRVAGCFKLADVTFVFISMSSKQF